MEIITAATTTKKKDVKITNNMNTGERTHLTHIVFRNLSKRNVELFNLFWRFLLLRFAHFIKKMKISNEAVGRRMVLGFCERNCEKSERKFKRTKE